MITELCCNILEGLSGVADGKALPVEIDFLLVFNWTKGSALTIGVNLKKIALEYGHLRECL